MPKIPVPDETVAFSGAMMPGSSGDGYSAVGRSVQGLGNALTDLGAQFAAQTAKEDDYQDRLALLDWQNQQSIDQIKAHGEFNREEPNGFATERQTARTQSFNQDLLPRMRTEKGKRQAEVFWRSTGHNFYESDFRFEQGKREQKLFRDTNLAITNGFASIDAKTPEDAEKAVLGTMAGIDAIIRAAPLSLAHKDNLAKEAAQLGMARLRQAFTDSEGRVSDKFYEAAQRLMRAQGVDPSAPPQPSASPPSGAHEPAPDYRGRGGPASIRFNNPGAQYPGASSRKFGATHTEIIGGGHQIAVFPDAVSGAAAQFDLLDRKYAGKTVQSAIATWSGGNSVGTYLSVLKRDAGLNPSDVLTKEMLRDPKIAIPIAKAMATQEAGRPYPMSDGQWAAAHARAFGAGTASPVRVADASGRIPASTGAAPSVAGAQYGGGAKGQFTEALIRGMPQFAKEAEAAQERWAKGVEGQFKTIVDLADKGYATEAQVEQVQKLLTERPDLAKRFGLDQAGAALNGYVAELREMHSMTPIDLEATIGAVDRNIRSAAPDTPPDTIAQAVKRKERMQTLLGNMRTGLKEDAITWADRSRVMPMTRIDLQKPDGMMARIAAAHTIAERYGQPVQFFTKIEREQLGAILKQGGDTMLGVLGTLSKQLGPDMMTAMAEIGKQAPEAATIGWMMTSGLPQQTIKDAALGMERHAKREAGEKLIAPPAIKDEREAFAETFGNAFRELPEATNAVRATAKAIYEVRAQRLGLKEPDKNLFASILKEVVGETSDGNHTYGGIYRQSGGIFSGTSDPIIVPPNMRQNGVREALDAIYSIDELTDKRRALQAVRDPNGKWVGARSPWLEEKHPADTTPPSALAIVADAPDKYVSRPVDDSGRPLSIGALRRAKLISVGPGQYVMAMGDTTSKEPGFVKNVDGRPFVLDLNKLEPLIRKRRPDLYKGYVNPDYAMPTNRTAVAP